MLQRTSGSGTTSRSLSPKANLGRLPKPTATAVSVDARTETTLVFLLCLRSALGIATRETMSASQPNGRGDGEGEKGKEAAVVKTAGFVVFSGIAMSILKALNLNFCQHNGNNAPKPCEKSTPSIDDTKNERSVRTIEIVKGDTLWGLSRKYGVSVDAIKEANGLSGDTIYAGRKLIIP